jgi:hypothetical protein
MQYQHQPAQRTTANRYGLNRPEVSVQHGGEIRGQSILIPGKTTKEVARARYWKPSVQTSLL